MSAADLALVGCRIRTLDPQAPFATAVAARDGVTIAVGDDANIREHCDARTEVIDGKGMTLTPGLTDSHQHVLSAIDVVRGADLTRVRTMEELREAIFGERLRVGPDGWVFGWGLDYGAFGDAPLSNAAIERAVGHQPALLRFMDVHTAIASAAALRLAGVNGAVTFADGSRVVCRNGVPTGELDERSAIELVTAAAPPPSHREAAEAARQALKACSRLGLTAIHVMDGTSASFDLAAELEESGQLDARLVIPVWHQPGTAIEETERQLGSCLRRGRLWRGGVVKFFADGVIETGTGWLLEPDGFGRRTTSIWRSLADYFTAVRHFCDLGFQCVTHAIGDAAVRHALDVYEMAEQRGLIPRNGPRHRIEHVETLADADIGRFAAIGVVASMQPVHLQWRRDDGSDLWTRALGPERTARAFRCAELLASGAIVPLGSDWPVASADPRLGMAWARLRREPRTQRPAFLPDQCLTGLQALEGYTVMAARAAGECAVAGRIKPGFRADFTGFLEDPVECDADTLVDLPITLTVVEGRVVWRSDSV